MKYPFYVSMPKEREIFMAGYLNIMPPMQVNGNISLRMPWCDTEKAVGIATFQLRKDENTGALYYYAMVEMEHYIDYCKAVMAHEDYQRQQGRLR